MKMVRKYQRITRRRDSSLIIRALQAIELGMTNRAAAREFDVPESTLRRHRKINKEDDSTAESMGGETEAATAIQSTQIAYLACTDQVQPVSSTRSFIIKPHGGSTVHILLAMR